MPRKPPAKPNGSRIAAISVCGYKSIFEKRRIELRPLTLLAGANSSGKSSMIQPLLLLKQTLQTSHDPGPLLLDGPNVHLTSVDQLLSRTKGRLCASEFSVGLEAGDGSRVELTFFRGSREKGIGLRSMSYSNGRSESGTLLPNMSAEQIWQVLPPPARHFYEMVAKEQKATVQLEVAQSRCFLYVDVALRRAEAPELVHFPPMSPLFPLDAGIRRVIHLPGLRGNPERTYPRTAGGPDFVGVFQTYVASIVAQWQEARDKSRLKDLALTLEGLGLTWTVKAKRVDDTQVELEVGRLPHGQRGGAYDLVSIADVGFGVSQTLPVLVALLVARPGQIVYLEQPELHLHPRAQTRLASVLAEAARRQVTVVAETHSALLLRSVQTLVANGELSPDLIKLHWFRRREDGATEVDSTDLDERGRFEKGWPQDFDEVALTVDSDYLDAVEAHQ